MELIFYIGIILFFPVTIHEIGHYLTARYFGIKPKYFILSSKIFILNKLNSIIKINTANTHFSINPFVTSGMVESLTYMYEENNKNKMIFIALAGPLTNLLCAVFVLFIYPDVILEYKFDNNYMYFINMFFYVSLINFIINILPYSNTDGFFISQYLKKTGNRNKRFYDYNVHYNEVQSQVNTNTYKYEIKPIFDNYLINYRN